MATLDLTKRDQVPIRSVITGDEEIAIVVGNLLYVLPVNTLIDKSSLSVEWSNIIGRPTTYPPSNHTHLASDIIGLGTLALKNSITSGDIETDNSPSAGTFLSYDNKWLVPSGAGDMLKADNLSGLASNATARTNIGLGNVDNTSDVSKPISLATQTALNLKANLADPTFTGTPTAPTASAGTNTTQIATTAFTNAALAARPQAGLHVMTASGNFTVPSGVSYIDVQLWGAGGGGGGVGTAGQSAGGGGGGGYCRDRLAVTPGQVIPATVGAGGSGNSGGAGTNGGNTTFGALVAYGGGGGQPNPSGSGGIGGSATGGSINISGGTGGSGSGNIAGGAHGGNGGSAAFGGAGAAVAIYTGGPGQSPGGGGGGGGGGNTNAGGSGAHGMIIIRY